MREDHIRHMKRRLLDFRFSSSKNPESSQDLYGRDFFTDAEALEMVIFMAEGLPVDEPAPEPEPPSDSENDIPLPETVWLDRPSEGPSQAAPVTGKGRPRKK